MKKNNFVFRGGYTAPKIELYSAPVEKGFAETLVDVYGNKIDAAGYDDWGTLE